MKVTELKLQGTLLIEPTVHGDHRGFFLESYNKAAFEEVGIHQEFIQDNHSYSAEAGTLRGLHYQLEPKGQTKLVRVITGAIYDVAVDIRKYSPTYGQWAGVILSESNKRQFLIPKGFAHGFCTLTPNTQVLYKVDELYSAAHDRGILWSDPELEIDWHSSHIVLSDKDKIHPRLSQAENNFGRRDG
ncbi:dTDP-4-dehydrorhamnose 3,5-epimerase [Paenibacillus sp. IHBB 10380]|uniref:dTDP-4-dehydrorhamnose 3,5-epimerase n=1 Tax=Paenibacillus sp. IHBB 10380 TaxID=1566358 RepID=UPI0005CFB8F8|nr:dTDP-4-dehydrorhamnose 3,5-epimerase [Paenibacillus sp. IHBB 10380]AJS60035.1 dTDP-4-dehydrorhamnose 3,5-epimerase [Paenibacillus sp. IHBB 10380]